MQKHQKENVSQQRGHDVPPKIVGCLCVIKLIIF